MEIFDRCSYNNSIKRKENGFGSFTMVSVILVKSIKADNSPICLGGLFALQCYGDIWCVREMIGYEYKKSAVLYVCL